MKLLFKSLVCDLYYLLFFAFTFPVWFTLVLARRSWRRGFFQRLAFLSLAEPKKPRIWIHGVSVGEVLASQALVRKLAGDPRFEVVISTTTRTGFEVARKRFPGLQAFHFPLDLSFFVRRALRIVSPALVVMVELEVWPNFLINAMRLGVPVTFVNGRITRRSAESYPVISWLLRPVFENTDLFCVQNEEYASRLLHLGAPGQRIRITGNLKYDNLPAEHDPEEAAATAAELGIEPGQRVIVAGSIHPGEDEILVEVFGKLSKSRPELRLVLVPRHPERFDRAEEVARAAGFRVHRRTKGRPEPGGKPVLLLDTMGELDKVYAAADLVFVGGSLVLHGGQNMMEPAAFGKAVVFGPHVHNFADDAAFLLERKAAVQVRDGQDLARALEEFLADPAKAEKTGLEAERAVAVRRGATARTLEALEKVYLARLAPKGPQEGEIRAEKD